MKGALGDLCVRERIAEIGRFTGTWKEVTVAAAVVKDKDVADASVRFASHRQKKKEKKIKKEIQKYICVYKLQEKSQ